LNVPLPWRPDGQNFPAGDAVVVHGAPPGVSRFSPSSCARFGKRDRVVVGDGDDDR
jgi:hypothetical protein